MNLIKNKIKAVIFDMDGTIVKTENIWNKVCNDLLKEYGVISISEQQAQLLDKITGMGLIDAASVYKRVFDIKDSVDTIVQRKISLSNKYFEHTVDYVDGFVQFHKKLRDNLIQTGIATNAHPENLQAIAKTMQFERLFGGHLYCIAHVNYKPKPNPALFLHTAQQLEARPEECVVFEDSIHGFEAAKAAGMRCIAIKNQENTKLLTHADYAIENYHEAENILKKL